VPVLLHVVSAVHAALPSVRGLLARRSRRQVRPRQILCVQHHLPLVVVRIISGWVFLRLDLFCCPSVHPSYAHASGRDASGSSGRNFYFADIDSPPLGSLLGASHSHRASYLWLLDCEVSRLRLRCMHAL